MTSPCHVAMLARWPTYGRGKTRLAQDIGAARAVWFQRHAMARLTRALWHPRCWRFWLVIAGRVPHHLPRGYAQYWGDVPCIAQGHGDLGGRIGALWQRFSPACIIVIGSDLPSVTAQDIRATRRALQRTDVVLGPSRDGGFWLLGMRPQPKRAVSGLFAGLGWSQADTRAQLIARLAPRHITLLEERCDIDTGADYYTT